jgi:hypothetical protein
MVLQQQELSQQSTFKEPLESAEVQRVECSAGGEDHDHLPRSNAQPRVKVYQQQDCSRMP